ncbi:MAG: cysteine desulfurase [Nitrososphaerales archaeon]
MLEAKYYDVYKIREDFPILKRKVHGKPLIYFDNAATSQKPQRVIEAIYRYYKEYNANIHRGVHKLAEEATEAFEEARDKVAKFINARYREEVIFVRGTTEAINLVSRAWGDYNVKEGEKILITEMEHHSNIVPWFLLSDRKKSKVEFVKITDEGLLDIQDLNEKLDEKVKLVSLAHSSNVLGTINPVKEISKLSHEKNALFLVDGAQSVPHLKVDVQEIDCDFLAFSGHKMLGPTGIGVLYAKREILEKMEPFLGGGDMIKEVHKWGARWKELPWKYEAGTSNIAGAIGLGEAISYLLSIGMDKIREHEKDITSYTLKRMREIENVKIYGPEDANKKCGIVSFNLGDIHPHDLATLLDEEGIAVRAGHHCAQPLMERLNIPATTRASFYLYNTKEEVDVFIETLKKAQKIFLP